MITFGLCAYNEEKSIARAITSIVPQTGPGDEILIVASGCTDNTISVVTAINDARIRIISEPVRSGKANATNILVKNARGDIIIYMDADIVVDDHAVAYLLKHFRNPSIAAVSGRMIIRQDKTIFDRICAFSRQALHKEKMKDQRAKRFWALNGYLFAFRKNRYIPLPATNLVEDALLGWLIYNKGGTIIYEPRAQAYEKAPQTLRDWRRSGVRPLSRAGQRCSRKLRTARVLQEVPLAGGKG